MGIGPPGGPPKRAGPPGPPGAPGIPGRGRIGKFGRPFGPKGRFIPGGITRGGGAGGAFGLKTVTCMRNTTIAAAPATAARSGTFIFEGEAAPVAGAPAGGATAAWGLVEGLSG